MKPVAIENPTLNSPFEEPSRHFRFDEQGITPDIVDARRVSSYFMPIARPRRLGEQMRLETEWAEDRIQENKRVIAFASAYRSGAQLGMSVSARRLRANWELHHRSH